MYVKSLLARVCVAEGDRGIMDECVQPCLEYAYPALPPDHQWKSTLASQVEELRITLDTLA